jgi:hypothetical protein
MPHPARQICLAPAVEAASRSVCFVDSLPYLGAGKLDLPRRKEIATEKALAYL